MAEIGQILQIDAMREIMTQYLYYVNNIVNIMIITEIMNC